MQQYFNYTKCHSYINVMCYMHSKCNNTLTMLSAKCYSYGKLCANLFEKKNQQLYSILKITYLLYYEWTCQELVAVVTEREPPLGVGLAGGGSGGGVCGLAVAGVGLPLDACGAEHHGYNYL